MNQKPLQLALIGQHVQRAEQIKQASIGQGWQLLPFIGQQMPHEWLQRLSVDAILVDLDMPNAVGVIGELARAVPATPIIVVATPDHLVDLQNALLAGAKDFLAFPTSDEQFNATVQRVLQVATPAGAAPAGVPMADVASTAMARRGRVVAVTGLRGGVGRSSIAVNLAIALHNRQLIDVVLTEAHNELSNISLMLNLHPRHTTAMLNEEQNIDIDLLRGYLQPHSAGIRILSAPTNLESLVEFSGDIWKRTLGLLSEVAPFVIVDTSSIADSVLSEVLLRADDIVVVADPDIASLRSAMSLLKILQMEDEVNGRVHVVLNRVGINGGLDEATIRKQLGHDIAVGIPDDPALATYAFNRGVPFVMSHPRAIMSRRIHALADHLLGRMPQGEKAADKPRSIFSFLGRR